MLVVCAGLVNVVNVLLPSLLVRAGLVRVVNVLPPVLLERVGTDEEIVTVLAVIVE